MTTAIGVSGKPKPRKKNGSRLRPDGEIIYGYLHIVGGRIEHLHRLRAVRHLLRRISPMHKAKAPYPIFDPLHRPSLSGQQLQHLQIFAHHRQHPYIHHTIHPPCIYKHHECRDLLTPTLTHLHQVHPQLNPRPTILLHPTQNHMPRLETRIQAAVLPAPRRHHFPHTHSPSRVVMTMDTIVPFQAM